MPTISNYRGIIPAIACTFTADGRIDEPALRRLASWLAGHKGVVAIMTNGHTGEVFSLTPLERAEVTRIVADELKGRVPVISSIVCEGLADAAEHARLAKAAGAAALDVMPPHHWLRFGFHADHACVGFAGRLARAVNRFLERRDDGLNAHGFFQIALLHCSKQINDELRDETCKSDQRAVHTLHHGSQQIFVMAGQNGLAGVSFTDGFQVSGVFAHLALADLEGPHIRQARQIRQQFGRIRCLAVGRVNVANQIKL